MPWGTSTAVLVSLWPQQIYDEVYAASDSYPSHVIFGTKPVSKVGDLKVTAGIPYYFSTVGGQASLDAQRFEPDRNNTGAYVINYTAYDSRGRTYPVH